MGTMQQQSSTAANSAAGVNSQKAEPEIRPASHWTVISLEVLSGYRLKVGFRDKLSGIVDMQAFVRSKDAGVFSRLQDEQLFAKARISYGAVVWPEEGGQPALDLAPDAMHKAISQAGTWIL